MKRKLRIYVDTSVIGGCFDDEFKLWSNKLIQEFRDGLHIPVISELIQAEISLAPQEVRHMLLDLMKCQCQVLAETEESIGLAHKYLTAAILSKKFENDARHIALATIHNVNMVVSWNFKHIVHFDKIQKFNSVNIREGYKTIEIYSPMEVVNYGI
jgi:hypothetical protein